MRLTTYHIQKNFCDTVSCIDAVSWENGTLEIFVNSRRFENFEPSSFHYNLTEDSHKILELHDECRIYNVTDLDQLDWINSWETFSPAPKKVVELIHVGDPNVRLIDSEKLAAVLRRTRELFESKVVVELFWATSATGETALPIVERDSYLRPYRYINDFVYSECVEELLKVGTL